MNRKYLNKSIAMSMATIMLLQLTACGTVFYPERKGTKSGSIDPVVAVADAIGLLFFFIPGVIAFAVDFYTGTIYLPNGRYSNLTPAEIKSVTMNGTLDKKALSRLISQKLSQPIDLDTADVQTKQFSSKESMLTYMNVAGLSFAGL